MDASPLWAKWGRDGQERYPLLAHLVDTHAAAVTLLDRWVPQRALRSLARLAGQSPDGVRTTVLTGAALHDVGKATPVFQGQLLSPARDRFAAHSAQLAAAGLGVPSGMPTGAVSDTERRELARHEVAGAVLLSDTFDGAGAEGVAAVVAGHHGSWHIPDASTVGYPQLYYHQLADDVAWAGVHDHLVTVLVDALGIDPDVRPDPAAVPVLTALVCLADWLASDWAADEQASAQVWPEDPCGWRRLHAGRVTVFEQRVGALLGTAHPPVGSFEEVFGFPASRPVQREMVGQHRQGLSVVMVPTGDGKTEAALGHWLTNRQQRQGLYFALPTMATADAMLSRVERLFSQAEDVTAGALLHGRALLNAFYQPTQRELDAETHDGPHGGGLRPADWFSGRHRALLAPVAVGTIDQLLAAALRHRFSFMRLLAASTKTLVLDEVHTYDPYMSQLLERLLAWCGALDIDVVLLSATLPAARVRAYVQAYTGEPAPPKQLIYPGVVRAQRDDQGSFVLTEQALEVSDRGRTIELAYWRGDPTPTVVAGVRELRRAYPDAKIGVLVSTVARCQAVGAALADLHPDVLHARFTADRRADQVHDLIDRYGAGATAGAALLVATQVVEASVDIDLDVLVTDLAPAASLLQRAGRLWRHHQPERRSRPAGLDQPLLIVAAADPLPTEDLFAFLPYTTAECVATWRLSLDGGARNRIVVPDDVQQMVDDAHIDWDTIAAGEAALEEHLTAQMHYQLAATGRTVPTPTQLSNNPARHLSEYGRGDIQEERATRWVDRHTVTALLVGAAPGAWSGELPADPTPAQVRQLLGCTVPLSGANAHLAERCAAAGRFATTRFTHRLLTDLVVVDLDATGHFTLDPQLGLLTNRSADA